MNRAILKHNTPMRIGGSCLLTFDDYFLDDLKKVVGTATNTFFFIFHFGSGRASTRALRNKINKLVAFAGEWKSNYYVRVRVLYVVIP